MIRFKRTARAQADRLIRRLRVVNPHVKWKARVWENVGWHWELRLAAGHMTLHEIAASFPGGMRRYYTGLSMKKDGHGTRAEYALCDGGYLIPELAISAQMKRLYEDLEERAALHRKMQKALA